MTATYDASGFVGGDQPKTPVSLCVNPTVAQITAAIEERKADIAAFLDLLHTHGQTTSITITSDLGTWTCSFRGHPKEGAAR